MAGHITDNEAKMKALWKRIEETYPKVMAYGCATHMLHLLLSDIAALEPFKTMLDDARCVIKWFRNHHYTNGLVKTFTMRRFGNELRIIKPCATRFASMVYATERLKLLKGVLRNITSEDEYEQYLRRRKDSEGEKATRIVDSAGFWGSLSAFLNVTLPVRQFLRYTDSGQSLACKVPRLASSIKLTRFLYRYTTGSSS